MQVKYNLLPYWMDCDDATQDQRIIEFTRQVYPIWAPILERGVKEEWSDANIQHAMDLAIFDSGFRINRLGNDFKQKLKEKVGEKFRAAMS